MLKHPIPQVSNYLEKQECRVDPERMLQVARDDRNRFVTLKAALMDAAHSVDFHISSQEETHLFALIGKLESRVYAAEQSIEYWLKEMDK